MKTGYHRADVLRNLGFSKFTGREDLLKMEKRVQLSIVN